MNAAGQDARLRRRPHPRRTPDAGDVDLPAKRLEQPTARLVVADETEGDRAPADGRAVVGRIAGAAGHDFRRVVLENEYRRFARDARDLTVDELVDDQIAKHRNRSVGKVVDEREQALSIGGRRW